MVPLTKMRPLHVCMPTRSHRSTAAAFSGGGSSERVHYECPKCMLARVYVCVHVHPSSWYAADLCSVPHFHISPSSGALKKCNEKQRQSNNLAESNDCAMVSSAAVPTWP